MMKRFDVAATARASFGVYNTVGEAETLANALQRAKEIFAR